MEKGAPLLAAPPAFPEPSPARGGWYARRGKRALDLVLAVPGLLVLSPFLLVLALLVGYFWGARSSFGRSDRGSTDATLPCTSSAQ